MSPSSTATCGPVAYRSTSTRTRTTLDQRSSSAPAYSPKPTGTPTVFGTGAVWDLTPTPTLTATVTSRGTRQSAGSPPRSEPDADVVMAVSRSRRLIPRWCPRRLVQRVPSIRAGGTAVVGRHPLVGGCAPGSAGFGLRYRRASLVSGRKRAREPWANQANAPCAGRLGAIPSTSTRLGSTHHARPNETRQRPPDVCFCLGGCDYARKHLAPLYVKALARTDRSRVLFRRPAVGCSVGCAGPGSG